MANVAVALASLASTLALATAEFKLAACASALLWIEDRALLADETLWLALLCAAAIANAALA